MAKNDSPLERVEQARFVDWLDSQGLLFSATAQSTYTTSWNQKRLNNATGLRKGVPDMLVIIPIERARDSIGRVVFVELKRIKGGAVSPEQKKWIAALNAVGGTVDAFVAHGADEAIEEIARIIGVSTDKVVF